MLIDTMKIAVCIATLIYCHLACEAKLMRCTSSPYIKVNRIYGAQDAKPMEFPHQASLRIRYFNNHICGGTLIEDKWVLTAAHCFSRTTSPYYWKVQLGEHNLKIKEPSEKEFLVSKVIIHENYNRDNQLNDIALLKLNQSVFGFGTRSSIKPICLADRSFAARTGYQCVVTGWGRSEKGSVTTDVLQKLDQPLVEWQKCARIWDGIGWPVTEKHICVGDLTSENGVCTGDSGGPVQCKLNNGEWAQLGITSWTASSCTAQGYAAVFTRVSAFRQWIEDKIENN